MSGLLGDPGEGQPMIDRSATKDSDLPSSSSALPARQLVDQWRPIETAPKGVTVLVAFKNCFGSQRVTTAAYFDAGALDMDDEQDGGIDEEGKNADAGWFEDSQYRDPGYWQMTDKTISHWMPLPAPPALAALLDPAPPETKFDCEDHILICPKCEREQPTTIVTVDFQCYWCGHREPDNAPLPTVAKSRRPAPPETKAEEELARIPGPSSSEPMSTRSPLKGDS